MKITDWSDIFYYCDGAIYWKIRTSNRVKIGSEVKAVGVIDIRLLESMASSILFIASSGKCIMGKFLTECRFII